MKINMHTAQAQYFSRPDDQKFYSLDDLRAAADAEKLAARTARLYTSDIKIEATGNPDSPIALYGTTNTRAGFTPWAFGQLCAYLRAPSDYLRRQAPELMADCLRADISRAAADPENFRPEHRALFRAGTDGSLTVRALTSTKYARLWDADLLSITEHWKAANPAIDLPPIWDRDANGQRRRGGAYRSDRDMFLLLTDGGSIVDDPSAGPGGGALYRGVIIVNSETGASTCDVFGFLFRAICGNHNIWGFSQSLDFSRRHVGHGFHHEVSTALRRITNWLSRPASDDVKMINAALTQTIGDDDKAAIDNLTRTLKIPQSTAEAAIRAAEAHETCNPRSIWGAVQGLTRISQDREHFADRMALDLIAARLLNRVKVAAA